MVHVQPAVDPMSAPARRISQKMRTCLFWETVVVSQRRFLEIVHVQPALDHKLFPVNSILQKMRTRIFWEMPLVQLRTILERVRVQRALSFKSVPETVVVVPKTFLKVHQANQKILNFVLGKMTLLWTMMVFLRRMVYSYRNIEILKLLLKSSRDLEILFLWKKMVTAGEMLPLLNRIFLLKIRTFLRQAKLNRVL